MICALLALPLPLRAAGRIPVLHVGIVLGSCFSRFSFFFGVGFLEFAFGMGGRRRRSGGTHGVCLSVAKHQLGGRVLFSLVMIRRGWA